MAINHKSIPKDDSTILLICALAITLLLFFVDEGSMTFNWMASVGNWILFIIYAVFIFIGEVFVSTILLRKYQSTVYTLLSVATGSGLGILFVVKVVMSNW
ncbi:MAG: cell shape-determining protein MreC [Salibacteraceae bacterium]|jgi:cell shape-determining protein MreC